jgi:hypothetical protein
MRAAKGCTALADAYSLKHSLQSRITATEQLRVAQNLISEPKTLLRSTEMRKTSTPTNRL